MQVKTNVACPAELLYILEFHIDEFNAKFM